MLLMGVPASTLCRATTPLDEKGRRPGGALPQLPGPPGYIPAGEGKMLQHRLCLMAAMGDRDTSGQVLSAVQRLMQACCVNRPTQPAAVICAGFKRGEPPNDDIFRLSGMPELEG